MSSQVKIITSHASYSFRRQSTVPLGAQSGVPKRLLERELPVLQLKDTRERKPASHRLKPVLHTDDISPLRPLPSILFLLCGIALLLPSLLTAAELERVPLPPGYTYGTDLIPQVEIPDPLFDPPRKGCHTCGDGDGIRLLYEDYAIWRHNLDRYGHKNSTWELLTFEVGTKSAWTGPQHAARLYQHTKDEVRFITRERLVVFEKRTDDDGKVSLECVSDPGEFSLRREGQRIVVDSPLRWWAFESAALGSDNDFRLVETCMHTFPFGIKLHYNGPYPMLPSELEYPDGKMARIEPAPGTEMVGKITLPNGIVYKIGYDANSFAESLEEYVPSTEPPKQDLKDFVIENVGGEIKQSVTYKEQKTYLVLAHRWAWENDNLGRIHHMVSPCGQETSLTFTQHTSDRGDEILTIMTDQSTGNYEYMRHIANAGVWTIERGHGLKNQAITEVTFDTRVTKKSMAHRMVETKRELAEHNLTVIIIRDKDNGDEIGRKILDKDGRPAWQREQHISQEDTPYTLDSISHLAGSRDQGRQISVIYGYRDDGILESATYQGTTHSFQFNDLGFLRVHDDGITAEAYTFTIFHQLESVKKLDIRGAGPPKHIANCDYRYYDDGRLKRYEADNGYVLNYEYGCSDLREVTQSRFRQTSYRFNSQGQLRKRLVRYDSSKGKIKNEHTISEQFRYRPDGQLDALMVRTGPSAPVVLSYEYDDEGIRHIKEHEGPIDPDDLTKTVFTRHMRIHPLTPPVTISFNRFGAVIAPAPRNTHQPCPDHLQQQRIER